MPVTFLGVNLNWAEGSSANDSIVRFTFGDFDLIQDLTLPTENVRLRMPTGVSASIYTLEESIELSWNEVSSASGYKVVRDFNLPGETVVLNGSTGYTIDSGVVTFIDNVGDNLEHTYVVLAKEADPEDKKKERKRVDEITHSMHT